MLSNWKKSASAETARSESKITIENIGADRNIDLAKIVTLSY